MSQNNYIVVAVAILTVLGSLILTYWRFYSDTSIWRQFAAEAGLVSDPLNILGLEFKATGMVRTQLVTLIGHRTRPEFMIVKAKLSAPIQLEIGIYPNDAAVSAVRRFTGRPQVQVDEPVFNKRFTFFSNDEIALRKWLASEAVKEKLASIKLLYHLEIKNGWVEFLQYGVTTNIAELEFLVELVTVLAEEYGAGQAVS